ncbi:MAG: methylenetetrahydrofolate reductase [NAD(P)H] [Succinivibrionaceae bacterium]|nr:methylenetetrahydrofolate reductase [NAD(P)H] [Succinivibrionaceae bacterium]
MSENNNVGWSFEVFPPKRTANVSSIYMALAELKKLKPDFISVTYGAGGSENCQATVEIANAVQNNYQMEAAAHLPCIGLTRQDVENQLAKFEEIGVKKILALRGDNPASGIIKPGDFAHASDLVEFIRSKNYDLNILAACYPETHYEAKSPEEDINNLKIKVDAGVDGLVSQLFFSNEYFYDFIDRIRAKQINVPVEAGIMPVINCKQIERMVSLCKVKLPKKFTDVMSKFSDNKEAMMEIGIAYAADQIIDLVANGVDGIHLYTMNNPNVALRIFEAVKNVINRA